MKNQQKWLTDKIPKAWCDKDLLIEICLFSILVDYVENEDNSLNSNNFDEEVKAGFISIEESARLLEKNHRINAAYKYIKNDRAILEAAIDDAYPDPAIYTGTNCTYKDMYGEVDRLTKIMEDADTAVMMLIVEIRGYLWS